MCTSNIAFTSRGAIFPNSPCQITATIAQHQPRALAWDAAHDALYIAGMGTDSILQLKNASQNTIAEGANVNLAQKDRCGPEGIAVGADGNLMVWCAFTRSIKIVQTPSPGFNRSTSQWALAALFRPARIQGRAVRALVRLPLDYSVPPN